MSLCQVTNLFHLLQLYNIRKILYDKKCKDYVNNCINTCKLMDSSLVFEKSSIRKIDISTREKLNDLLFDSNMADKYDLFVVSDENFNEFTALYHKAMFIFVQNTNREFKQEKTYCVYKKLNNCFEGTLYLNTFHSLIFPNIDLSVYEQTYVRDKPYRFLKKTVELFSTILDGNVIVEIGSCRQTLNHHIDDLNPVCCNDSHSTFFWCLTKAKVYTVDINPICENVFKTAHNNDQLIVAGKLKVQIQDGIKFLQDYREFEKKKPIDFLFLDAWDVIPDTEYAEKHLQAYKTAKKYLAKTCIVSIDDTDVGAGGKGKLLLPKLVKDGFIILYKGRHTVLYKGNVSDLFV